MGLDMYLTRKTYVKNWDRMKDEEKTKITVEGGRGTGIKPERIREIDEELGYWRKANAIHKWFVENCGDGEDDCREYYVSRKDLELLLETVNKVLAASELIEADVVNGQTLKDGKWVNCMEKGKTIKDPSVAKELLPTGSGFFFGSTEYDQWYYEALVYTKKLIKEVLAEPKGTGSIYYEASW